MPGQASQLTLFSFPRGPTSFSQHGLGLQVHALIRCQDSDLGVKRCYLYAKPRAPPQLCPTLSDGAPRGTTCCSNYYGLPPWSDFPRIFLHEDWACSIISFFPRLFGLLLSLQALLSVYQLVSPGQKQTQSTQTSSRYRIPLARWGHLFPSSRDTVW